MSHGVCLGRRQFLRAAGMSAAVLGIEGCTRSGSPRVTPDNYYVVKRERIVKEVGEILVKVRKVTAASHGDRLGNQIVAETEAGFADLLPRLPYIGGDANELTPNLYEAAAAMVFYQRMKAHGSTAEEAGRILYRAMEDLVAGAAIEAMLGSASSGKQMEEQMRRDAEQSRQRRYSGDWVFDFVPGDGQSLDYGIDYYECGICKLYRTHGAEEMTPYLCLLDFPVSAGFGTGLMRTTTLAQGGECCDFRYKRGRAIQMEWTPDFLRSA